MKQLIAGVVLATAGLGGVVAVAPADAGGTRFASCTKLHWVYPHGVASSAVLAAQARDRQGPPATTRRARRVYAANRSRLDPRGVGVACPT